MERMVSATSSCPLRSALHGSRVVAAKRPVRGLAIARERTVRGAPWRPPRLAVRAVSSARWVLLSATSFTVW
jgi:hypothetical protein